MQITKGFLTDFLLEVEKKVKADGVDNIGNQLNILGNNLLVLPKMWEGVMQAQCGDFMVYIDVDGDVLEIDILDNSKLEDNLVAQFRGDGDNSQISFNYDIRLKPIFSLPKIPLEVKKEICVQWWARLCENRFEGMSFESLTIDMLGFKHEVYSQKEGNKQEIRLYVKEGGRFECDFTCILQDKKWENVIIMNSDNVQVVEILFAEIIRIENV